MSETLVRVEHVSKKFSRSLRRALAYGVRDIASELSGRSRGSSTLRKGEFWALQDISFELPRGAGLGLIGANGSGKTTLLRLLSGLIKPDTGCINIRGRVAPLIALGAGFNPILTGRENVFINMAMLGMRHREILERFEQVLDFAEIGDAIDAPLQTYSSGMAARLGFACAVHTSADVVFVDEVLSVGDMRFRAKCYRKLAELRENGVGFVLVSHNLNSIMAMTDQVIYLKQGREVASGDPVEVVTQYESDMAELPVLPTANRLDGKASSQASTGLRISDLYFEDVHRTRTNELRSGAPGRLVVRYHADHQIDNLVVTLLVREMAEEMRLVLNLSSERDGEMLGLLPGDGQVELELPHTVLGPGLYVAKLLLGTPGYFVFDAVESYRFLVRADASMTQCALYQPRSWKVLSDGETASSMRLG